MRQNSVAAAAIALGSVLTATLAGSRFSPRRPRAARWYASLRKPSYTPPGPAIGAAWTALDGLLAYAGYRLIAHRHERGAAAAIAGWAATVSGLAGYPAAFFGARSTEGGAAASAAMCCAAVTTAVTAARVDQRASVAMAPLAIWTAFATLLSEELWRRNPGR